MDLRLYGSVLWRHKQIVGAGFALACLLAFFSAVTITSKGFAYRQAQQWSARQLMLVGQKGFSAGQVVLGPQGQAANTNANTNTAAFDPNRFNDLAILYARMVNSDAVQNLIQRQGPVTHSESVQAAPVIQADTNTPLPLISVMGLGKTPAEAVHMARRASSALGDYITQQQNLDRVSPQNRVIVSVFEQAKLKSPMQGDPAMPQLVRGRSKTRPIVIFLVVLFVVIGIAFLRENLKSAPGAEAGRETVPYPSLGSDGRADAEPAHETAFPGGGEAPKRRRTQREAGPGTAPYPSLGSDGRADAEPAHETAFPGGGEAPKRRRTQRVPRA
jgi:capsular polysaccharide biosynthesis protein